MSHLEGIKWSQVSSLAPGDRFLVSRNSEGEVRWVSPTLLLEVPGSLTLAAAEVTSSVQKPGTAEQTGLLGWSSVFVVRFDCEGKGWEVETRGVDVAYLLLPHHVTCGGCGELWPCRDRRIDWQAKRLTMQLDDMCAHCGKPIGGAYDVRIPDGVTTRRYHQAKKYRANGKRCVDAAREARGSISGVAL